MKKSEKSAFWAGVLLTVMIGLTLIGLWAMASTPESQRWQAFFVLLCFLSASGCGIGAVKLLGAADA